MIWYIHQMWDQKMILKIYFQCLKIYILHEMSFASSNISPKDEIFILKFYLKSEIFILYSNRKILEVVISSDRYEI